MTYSAEYLSRPTEELLRVTCHDVVECEQEIKELRAEKVRMELMLKKIQRGIAQEKDLEIKRQAKKEKRNA